jgi:hypothetical protein
MTAVADSPQWCAEPGCRSSSTSHGNPRRFGQRCRPSTTISDPPDLHPDHQSNPLPLDDRPSGRPNRSRDYPRGPDPVAKSP